jgi:hypothetical protein
VVWQSLTLGAGALVIGLPLGVLAGRVVWTRYARGLGVAPTAFLPLTPVVLAVAGTIIVALLAAGPPSWFVTRANLADTLRRGD